MNLPHLSDRRRATLRRAAQCAAGLGAGVALLIPAAADAACTYGPDQCKPGFVWRDGFANDHACVTPPERGRFLAAKCPGQCTPLAQWAGRTGRTPCLPGYVWREAWPNDQGLCDGRRTRPGPAVGESGRSQPRPCLCGHGDGAVAGAAAGHGVRQDADARARWDQARHAKRPDQRLDRPRADHETRACCRPSIRR